jgi:nucleoside-diphosphate-sugar epimerase
MHQTLLFLGYGFTAKALSRRLLPLGWSLRAAIRSAETAALAASEGFAPFRWRDGVIDRAAFDRLGAALVSTPPTKDGCPAFEAASKALAAARPGWIGYLSATSVYGDCGGAWIDEEAPLNPSTDRGRARAAAEAQWRAFSQQHDLPLVIFRIAGIYGPGRSAIDAVRTGRAQRVEKPGQMFNRIHVDDLTRALHASIDDPSFGELFNIADDEPAAPQDVVAYACRLLGVPPPPVVPFEKAQLSDMARSFYAENKRVLNARMKERLIKTLTYPNYREGLEAIVNNR